MCSDKRMHKVMKPFSVYSLFIKGQKKVRYRTSGNKSQITVIGLDGTEIIIQLKYTPMNGTKGTVTLCTANNGIILIMNGLGQRLVLIAAINDQGI